jgi:riboflavin kinase/FMN adenylyltransferase
MEIVTSLSEVKSPFVRAVVTAGNFDGVHLGHQLLLKKVIERAQAIEGTSIVFTFDPHPEMVLKGRHLPLITPFANKIELMAQHGVEVVICPPFTLEFAQIRAADFIKNILVKKIGMKEIIVGYNYTFGRKGEGNVKLLKDWENELRIKLHIIKPLKVNGIVVSSTEVRELITKGEVEKVVAFLGRYYQVTGKVILGHNRGRRLLGIPTANLTLVNEVFPKPGVYAVKVIYEGKEYKGVANIGFNPTFGNNTLSIETHILSFNKNIYGEVIKLNFIKRLRDEKKFSKIEELAIKIKSDIETAKKLLS